jgi:glutamyl-tRNA reductase
MNLLAVGCNFEKTPVEVRERLAFDEKSAVRALDDLTSRFGYEAVILSTCNRVEVYLGQSAPPDSSPSREGEASVGLHELISEFLSEYQHFPLSQLQPLLYNYENVEAVRHLFRVAAGLDSLIVGEGQISGQVRRAYELAQGCSSVGPVLHALFQQANTVAGRVRTETGISRGRVS